MDAQIRGLLGSSGSWCQRVWRGCGRELQSILEDAENGLPALAREMLAGLLEQALPGFLELTFRLSPSAGCTHSPPPLRC
jgi:hypothetical protein